MPASREALIADLHPQKPDNWHGHPHSLKGKNPKGLKMDPRQNLDKLHEIVRVRASEDPYKISSHESVAAVSLDFRSRMRVSKRTVGWDQLLQAGDDRLPI